MSCDLPTRLAAIVALMKDKCEQCKCNYYEGISTCTLSLPSDACGTSGDGVVTELRAAILAMVAACELSATVSMPDAPADYGCLDDDYFDLIEDYIRGLRCRVYEYEPCAGQCPAALPDPLYMPDAGECIMIKWRGVYAWYDKNATAAALGYPHDVVLISGGDEACPATLPGGAHGCPALADVIADDVDWGDIGDYPVPHDAGDPYEVCHCFDPCATLGDYGDGEGMPAVMVLTQTEWDDLSNPTCIIITVDGDELCYCYNAQVVNPSNYIDWSVAAAACGGIDCAGCVACVGDYGTWVGTDCGDCPSTIEVTLSGFDGLYARDPYVGAACYVIRGVNGPYTLTQTSYSDCIYCNNDTAGRPILAFRDDTSGGWRVVIKGVFWPSSPHYDTCILSYEISPDTTVKRYGDLINPGPPHTNDVLTVWYVDFGPVGGACPSTGEWLFDSCWQTTACTETLALCDNVFDLACTVSA